VNLSQSTGEDWSDAKLVLSTSETDVLNAGVPKSDGLVIEPKQPPPPPQIKMKMKKQITALMTKQTARRTSGAVVRLDANPDEMGGIVDLDYDECDEGDFDYSDASLDLDTYLPEMSEGGALVLKTPMGVNYTVDELTTILSDSQSHKVLVATIPFEATISHITTPRKSPLAYLQVRPPPVPFYYHTYRPAVYSAR